MIARGPIRWSEGEPALRARIESALADGLHTATTLARSPRRTVLRLHRESEGPEAPKDADLVLKIHHTATGRHRLRERWKQSLGWSPAQREWEALGTLFAADVRVPRRLGLGRLADGDGFVVTEHLQGRALGAPPGDPEDPERRRLLEALADAIAPLHASGRLHGDLHLGNCWSTAAGIVLLDVQHARRSRSPTDRFRDLARLELSMSRAGWSTNERRALRERLDAGAGFDPVLRRFLRDHLRGRRRRVLRVGRNWAAVAVEGARGLRDRDLPAATLERLMDAEADRSTLGPRRGGRVTLHEAKTDGRLFVVKEYATARGLRPWLDAVRGSPAARAFRVGQTHALLSPYAARPLAFLEDRRLGLPRRSRLVLEHVGDDDLDRYRPGSETMQQRIACSLGEWLSDLHAWGVRHRDLKAGNLRVSVRPDSIRFWMIDVEDLRGPSEPSDASRLQALVQLNASLADDAFGITARRAGLGRYLQRLPFAMERSVLEQDLARRSLARAHHWKGEGCALGLR